MSAAASTGGFDSGSVISAKTCAVSSAPATSCPVAATAAIIISIGDRKGFVEDVASDCDPMPTPSAPRKDLDEGALFVVEVPGSEAMLR